MWRNQRPFHSKNDRSSKHAHRRTRTAEDVDDLTPKSQGPQAATPNIGKASTRNKYFLLEEGIGVQERRNQTIDSRCFDRNEEGGKKQHELQLGVESAQSYNTFGNSSSNDNLRLRMTRVDGFNSAIGLSHKRGGDKLGLVERACIPTTEVFGALETLSGILIFNTANKEERLALASRLRRWVVEDGTYLIREGDSDANETAIFMVASGKATISLNRTLNDGTVEEADVKDIKYPNYFGEGRVLGDKPAYASVRAKGELVVYYITREDFEELLSPATRALMVRDMHIRKYQNEHLDDLFSVIRKNPSGMACLARFAKEKLMGGEVAFTIDVEAYKRIEGHSSERKEMAERIVKTYISTSATSSGGSEVIYTSESQRKVLAAAMRRLWGSKMSRFHENLASNDPAISHRDGGSDDCRRTGTASAPEESRSSVGTGKCCDEGIRDQANHQDKAELSETSSAGGRREGDGNEVSKNVGEDRERSAPEEKLNANETNVERQEILFSGDSVWDFSNRCAFGPEGGEEEDGDAKKSEEEAKRALSLTLFDAILNQNAIPTMRQNIVPKFIQSSYYEVVLKELFPDVAEPNATSNGAPPSATLANKVDFAGGRERALSDSLEDVRLDPEEAAEKIAAAVAVAAAAARTQGKREGGSAAGREIDQAGSHVDEGGVACVGLGEETWPYTSRNDLDGELFSDEPLVTNFRQESTFASRISKAGLATRKKASGLCTTM